MILSGPKLGPDWCLTVSKEVRIGLRFKISPNEPYFGNRTKYNALIEAFLVPFFGPDGFLADPENGGPLRGFYKALKGIIWGSIWAYFCK